MKYIYYLLLLPIFLISCHEAPLEIVANEEQVSDSCLSPFCLPPLGVDTSCVKMQMLRDQMFYKPQSNWICRIPNIILQINQIWVNGSVNGSLAVSLIFPDDIEPGQYALLPSSTHTAIFVPTFNADNFVSVSGTLTITIHDKANRYLEGGFEFLAQNLNSAVLPTQDFEEGCFTAHY